VGRALHCALGLHPRPEEDGLRWIPDGDKILKGKKKKQKKKQMVTFLLVFCNVLYVRGLS